MWFLTLWLFPFNPTFHAFFVVAVVLLFVGNLISRVIEPVRHLSEPRLPTSTQYSTVHLIRHKNSCIYCSGSINNSYWYKKLLGQLLQFSFHIYLNFLSPPFPKVGTKKKTSRWKDSTFGSYERQTKYNTDS